MSRSYKKNPFVTESVCNTTKLAKRLANKRFRRNTELHQGGNYKKVSESWDIRDYKYWLSEEAATNWYINVCDNSYIKGKYPTLEQYLNYWAKFAVRK